MSCLSALGSQIFTFVSVPHEVLSFQHQVFQEYAKVALGPDFSHTLPSLIIITAVCIALRRYLSIKWWPIGNIKSIFHETLKVVCSWVVVNAVLWYWLIFQRVLYCTIWTYWTNDPGIREIYLPWWRKVWSSFHPPTQPPPVLSASLISWILTMMLANIGLLGAIYADDVSSSLQRVSFSIRGRIDRIKSCRNSIVTRQNELINDQMQEEIEATDKSEGGSFCDDCTSEVSSDMTHRNITQREISPICYGTNWTRPNDERKKPYRELSSRTLAGVTECLMPDDNYMSRELRNRRGCHTVMPSLSSEKSVSC